MLQLFILLDSFFLKKMCDNLPILLYFFCMCIYA